jgi:homoserine kinase
VAQLVEGPVRVSVPATSANLGPGFDSLGLALELRDQLEAEVLTSGLVVEVDGEGVGGVPLDESHLVVRSLRAGLEALGATVPGLRLTCHNVVPHARGLGSSSAAIVGGLALARALVVDGERVLDDAALVALAARIEGHPDNVAPAVLGGLVVSGQDRDGTFWAVPAPVSAGLSAVVLVPPDPVSTELARGLLPAQVPHADAAANAGRTALLVAALAVGPEHLLRATEDRLHQQQRRPAMPASLDLVDALRADGVPAVVSGAGPTVLSFVAGPDAAGAVLARCPDGWAAHHLPVSPDGVRRETLPAS